MRVCFVSASHQNVFFDELLEAFRDGLEARGVATERAVDHFPAPQDDLVYVFVPHEYLPLTHVDSHPGWRQLRRSVAICTEQPGTPWFATAAKVAADAGAAVDINELGVEALAREGVRARLVRLGYVPSWDRWGGDDTAGRPVDLTFMGGHTDRRGVALARCGHALRDHQLAFHVFETRLPHQADDPWFLSGERKWEALGRAKTILNVHRSELGYMEWQRVLGALINGCVVLTEHSLGYEPLVPGEHFISAHFDNLHLAARALVEDPERLSRIRQSAYRLLREEMTMEGSMDALAEALSEVAAWRLPGADPGEPVPVPRPAPPPVPQPAYVTAKAGDHEMMRMALKHLVLEVRDVKRRLATASDAHAEPPGDEEETFGPYRRAVPHVSVVVTVYNYEEYVPEALASVARSDYDSLEIVVVDDASSDDSVAAVRRTLEERPWVAAKLIRRGANSGLAAARNLGIAHARGDYVFILDADNAVYPKALGSLAGALDADHGASFAYGIIEQFNERGPGAIISWLGWDPRRLRYGNFVDAMAMLRRGDLLRVGGFTSDAAIHGWEDFALWCAMADAGRRGILVPDVIARYRVGLHSMISMTNIDVSGAWGALLRRYPVLRT
jgi:Glycosyl transferase family 2